MSGLSTIPPHGQAPVCVFRHPSVDTWVASTCFALVTNAALNVGVRDLLESLLQFFGEWARWVMWYFCG